MAKFRRTTDSSSSFSGRLMLLVVLSVLIIGALAIALQKLTRPAGTSEVRWDQDRLFLPLQSKGKLVSHTYYTLSYLEDYEVAEWVAYELFKENIIRPWVKRSDDFRADEAIPSGSATWEDYRGSGFDRGHLVPAGDMAFNERAISETFLMSNIAPQSRAFNQGIWRELEELTRDWAVSNGHLYVVSGTIFYGEDQKKIGDNGVRVPDAFYKILLDMDQPGQKSIGFLIPNAVSEESLNNFAVSVDSLESLSGLDFFGDFLEPDLESELEARADTSEWPINPKKFQLRKSVWNERAIKQQ